MKYFLFILDILKEYIIACVILPFAIVWLVADLIFFHEEPGAYYTGPQPTPDESGI